MKTKSTMIFFICCFTSWAVSSCKHKRSGSEVDGIQFVVAAPEMDALTAFNAISNENWDTACVHKPTGLQPDGQTPKVGQLDNYLGGAKVTTGVHIIMDQKEFSRQLSVSQEGSVNGSIGAIVKLSAEAQFAQEIAKSIDDQSVLISISVNVTTGSTQFPTEGPTQEAVITGTDGSTISELKTRTINSTRIQKTLHVYNYGTFREKCGDYYLAGFQNGGTFVALLRVSTTTETMRSKFRTFAGAKGQASIPALAKFLKDLGGSAEFENVDESTGSTRGLDIQSDVFQLPLRSKSSSSQAPGSSVVHTTGQVPGIPNACLKEDGTYRSDVKDPGLLQLCQALQNADEFVQYASDHPARTVAIFEPYLMNPIFEFRERKEYEVLLDKGIDFSSDANRLQIDLEKILDGIPPRLADPVKYFNRPDVNEGADRLKKYEDTIRDSYLKQLAVRRMECARALGKCNFKGLDFAEARSLEKQFPLPKPRPEYSNRIRPHLTITLGTNSDGDNGGERARFDNIGALDKPFWVSWVTFGPAPECYLQVYFRGGDNFNFAPPKSRIDRGCGLHLKHEVSIDLVDSAVKARWPEGDSWKLEFKVALRELDRMNEDDTIAESDWIKLGDYMEEVSVPAIAREVPLTTSIEGRKAAFEGSASIAYIRQ